MAAPAGTTATNTTTSTGAEAMTAGGMARADASQSPNSNNAKNANNVSNVNNNNNNNTEVWSSLLKSVGSSRLVPTKDVIILGDPHSGKSTLIEQLKAALPTPSSDALTNGDDGSASKTANGGVGALPTGSNGVTNTGNGSGPVMVEMGTGTSEDNMFAGQKKNDLALSYSFWNVEDDENEDTVARLGLYQIAGSHRSYHALLKYCLNTKTIADSVVIVVLDWSRPWTFMETLQRWVKVLGTAIEQICQEGAVPTAKWTKGKALMDELQEKLGRFLQEYSEPQPHPSAGSAVFSESQSFVLGSSDAQSVLLPLTEGCLTNNTGVPIIIVCTKSDHINNLEREMDYKEETFDYIQQSLRAICLKYGASLFYTSIHHPHTFSNLRQYLLHRLLTPSTLNNAQSQQQQQQQQPSSFPFKKRAQVVERDQVMVPAGWDSIGKIKVLRNGFDCESVAEGWDLDEKAEPSADGAAAEASELTNVVGARKVYEEVIVNPKRSHAPAMAQPIITAEDDQVFLERFFESLQRSSNQSTGFMAGASAASGAGSHGAHAGMSGPPVVGPLGSGYTSMLNSHHASSPPPSSSGSQSAGRAAGGRAGSGTNGYDPDEVERLKMFASKSKVNGGSASSSGLIGPSLAEGGLSAANMKLMATWGQSRANSGPSPTSGSASDLGGMVAPGAGAPGATGGAPSVGAASAAIGQTQTELLSNFFTSLMTRKGPAGAAPGVGAGGPAGGSAASVSTSVPAPAGSAGGAGSDDP
ncbi:hypothetical protein BG011_007807 [Mortierella polycephala]|uniref:DLIC-domain-containing protein n=1 Tax=Mortierella polycephala TaxID=41804 RepID=A0A9P6PRH4_9FUNG|nr:hypothetical protein BG011_007807 [Mortierella polycephala]